MQAQDDGEMAGCKPALHSRVIPSWPLVNRVRYSESACLVKLLVVDINLPMPCVGVTNLQCKLIFAKSTIQRYTNSRVDVGVVNSLCVLENCKVYRTKMQNSRGGRWSCNLTVSLKLAKSEVQRYSKMKVDVGVTNLQCIFKFTKYTKQRHTKSRVDVGGVGVTSLQCP